MRGHADQVAPTLAGNVNDRVMNNVAGQRLFFALDTSLLAKAEQDITAQRPACKTTMADVLALILARFILMVLAACAFLVVLWGLS